MAKATNPCGLSFDRTVEIIKSNVLGKPYNGRSDVLKGLMSDGFTYPEAKEVTDYYFSIYRRLGKDYNKNTLAAKAILSPQERKQRVMNNMAVSYLVGDTGGIPMEQADLDHLKKIYEKVEKADTPTLKEKFNEEANAFVHTFLPGYTNELFKSSVYARPLLSAVFFIKSMVSNFWGQVHRNIANTIWDGKKIDMKPLFKYEGLANRSFTNVLKGGVPATNLYQSEQQSAGGARLEEFPAAGKATEGWRRLYYGAMRFMTRWSNRLNSAPDTRGIYANAERHFYQLLKEHYRELGNDDKSATQLALQDMELDDLDTSTKMAEAKFAELGLPIRGKNGKYTSEFNVAVAEYQRLHRDETTWAKAIQLGKNDFWKRNFTMRSELGFGDHGIMGIKVELLSALRNKIERSAGKNKFSSAFNLYVFGFLNGAANFAEDALERMPIYAAIKLGFLQSTKSNTKDFMLKNDVARRQKDIIVKNLTTFAFFVASKMVEKAVCPHKKQKPSSEEISGGYKQIGACGIPILVPPQMMPMYKAYTIIDNALDNDEDFFNAALHILPVLVQGNQMGLGGQLDKIGTGMVDYSYAKSQGNNVKADEIKGKMIKNVTRIAADVANSYLPIPSRLLNEAATVAQRVKGITQQQQKLPFATDEMGKPLGVFQTIGKMTVANLGNVTGVSESMIAAFGSNKTYAVDWQGRKIAQFRGSDIVGSGIQYEAADDIIAEAGVKAPYVNRLTKIEVSSDKEAVVGFRKGTVEKKEVRYLTDAEYFDLNVALGKFNKQYFEDNHDDLVTLVKENDKQVASKMINHIFTSSQSAGVEAIEKGISDQDGIYEYIVDNWDNQSTKKKKTMTEKMQGRIDRMRNKFKRPTGRKQKISLTQTE